MPVPRPRVHLDQLNGDPHEVCEVDPRSLPPEEPTPMFWLAVRVALANALKAVLGTVLGEVEKVALELWSELPISQLSLKAAMYLAGVAVPEYLAFGRPGLLYAALAIPGIFVVNTLRVLLKMPLGDE